ncbi:MAG: leucyl/phenylalanyl-tRNA--protein transferase [Thermaurantimonas sp.]|uniref:leucyl/phenylalanyl-tRNA--protein transferase n=1 Tax=Thermaurantimonas sp. TaxID=2681568 RepID=UPI00391C95A0
MSSIFPYPSSNDPGDFPVFIGGDLSLPNLIDAYRHGYFPWYEPGTTIEWWSPDPRMVLFPEKVHVSHSMRTVFNRGHFHLTKNQAFEQVITHCACIKRRGQRGTWIGRDIIEAYTELHRIGIVHSYETWHEGRLVGGYYGVWLGKVFFGESMFSLEANASKFALISACREWVSSGAVKLIDCQMSTAHLRSLGAEEIDRKTFIELLRKWVG